MILASKLLFPFGIEVTVHEGTSFEEIDVEQIHDWVKTYKVLVLRGLRSFSKLQMPHAARRLGPLQPWSFGAVNELQAEADAKNYLYTNGAVPLHWDGAFTKKAPRYLFFQCLEAPPLDAGGETFFVDTTAAWEMASNEQQQRFRQVKIQYQTEKIVHYGGTVKACLVSTHPYTKKPILRFAEPVEDKNPVTVTPLDMDITSGKNLLLELYTLLHNPKVILVHQWQHGDLVLADNNALLHGRHRYTQHAPRRLLRVNVMDPKRTWMDAIRDSIRIRRPEFMIAEIPIFLIAVFLSATHLSLIHLPTIFATLLLFFLLFHFGDMTNCLADRELDTTYKTHLSEAVYGLGINQVRIQIATTLAVAACLSVWLSFQLGRPWIFLITLLGLGLGWQYSFKPLHLKGQGLWQIVTLWAIIFFGPMLLTMCTILPVPSLTVLGIAAAYGLLQQAIILINTAEDEPEDRSKQIHTAVVRLGLHCSLILSATLLTISTLAMLGLLGLLIHQRNLQAITYASLLLPFSACVWVFISICQLIRRTDKASKAETLKKIRASAKKMPLWITATAWSTCLATSIILWETCR